MPITDTLCLVAQANILLRMGQRSLLNVFTGNPDRREVILDSKRYTSAEVAGILRAIVLEQTSTPLLLIWAGHGSEDGWVWTYSRNNGVIFAYKDIANLLARATRPVLILNDACGGGALGELIEKRPAVAARVGVVSASASGGTAEGFFMIREFIESINSGRTFKPADVYCRWFNWSPLQTLPLDSIIVRNWRRICNIGRFLCGRPRLPKRLTIALTSNYLDVDEVGYPDAPVRHGTRELDRRIFKGVA